MMLLLLALTAAALASADPSGDAAALLEFRKPIAAGDLSSWDPSSPLPSWRGVSVDPKSGEVAALDLFSAGLSGEVKLSPLSSLRSLQNLSLAGNELSGRIVPVLRALASLRRLDLSGNRFYGPVPSGIADISTLVYLNLSGNELAGGFPASDFRRLQNLRSLDIRGNNFTGDMGELLSSLQYVEHVDLSDNAFYGGVDVGFVNMSSVGNTAKYLNLSWNGLGGAFFGLETLSAFKNVEVIDVGNTGIGGQLPPLDGLFALRVLRVDGNRMFGMLPGALFSSGMQIEEIDFSRNGFTGSVPSMNSSSLKMVNLSSNSLSGPLPSAIGKCISIDLSGNMLSGNLSALSSWDVSVEAIDLSSNVLSGIFPPEASQFNNLVSLKLANNSLSGPLPPTLQQYQNLAIVDFSLNKFTGPILPGLLSSLTMTSLNLSGNSLDGDIPFQSTHATKSLVVMYSHLQSLDLSSNLLSGPLPPEVGNMQELRILILANNNLSGELPVELSKLEGLEYLDISGNHFSGSIPDLPQKSLTVFNVSNNELSGPVPRSLERFPSSCFRPGNPSLVFPDGLELGGGVRTPSNSSKHNTEHGVRIALIIGGAVVALVVLSALLSFFLIRSHKCGGKVGSTSRDLKPGLGLPNLFKSSKDQPVEKTSFSNDYLLTSASRSMSGQKELLSEAAVEFGYNDPKEVPQSAAVQAPDEKADQVTGVPSPQHFVDPRFSISEQHVALEVYSPDRLAGELTFFDNSVMFTAEDLSRAPAEILGRSSHGTTYKATLSSGHVLSVKWLRVGLVKHKKEFAKEAKKIGMIRHPNIIPWRGFYWGPKEQERLIISDYAAGDSLALNLYESTPRRYSRLSVGQRLRIAIDIARCLSFLHYDKCLPHGDLKPTNVFLVGPELTAKLADYCLHRLMTSSGNAEQMLNLGALGYRAPELASASKPAPSFKADVYAFGVILMEMLTRKSAGDIISGQSGAVDLTDWVQMCNREGRGTDCFDRDIAGLEEAPRVMDELLAISLRCILPVNERPNIKTVLEELCSITM